MADRYIVVDEEGYFVFDSLRVTDVEAGLEMLTNMQVTEDDRLVTSLHGQLALVEAFDAPFVVRHITHMVNDLCEAELPYGHKQAFSMKTLTLDDWDRFHGRTTNGVPFVFSRQAQIEFFDLLESFDDESITIKGQRFPTPPWIESQIAAGTIEPEQPTDVVMELLPQLKLAKSRVLVMSAFPEQDARAFSDQGHVVTTVNLRTSSVFEIPEKNFGQIDLIYDSGSWSLTEPSRRNELVRQWQRLLQPQGQLLGMFPAVERSQGKSFGATEWEIRERLKNPFRFLFWTRWRQSTEKQKGKELIIFAEKRS